jgi:hypothetical protein
VRLKCERRRYDTEHILRNITFEEHLATLEWHEGYLNSWWVQLKPGVTGFESVSVANLLRDPAGRSLIGWFACAGAAGSYDELYVLPEEVERLKDFLRLVEPLLLIAKGGGGK